MLTFPATSFVAPPPYTPSEVPSNEPDTSTVIARGMPDLAAVVKLVAGSNGIAPDVPHVLGVDPPSATGAVLDVLIGFGTLFRLLLLAWVKKIMMK